MQTVLTQTNLTLRSILKNNWPKELERHIDKEIYALSKNGKNKMVGYLKMLESRIQREQEKQFLN